MNCSHHLSTSLRVAWSGASRVIPSNDRKLIKLTLSFRKLSFFMLISAILHLWYWLLIQSHKNTYTHVQQEYFKEYFFVEGYHLSIFTSCFPCSFSLYSKKSVNMPQPLSWTLIPKLRAWDIPFIYDHGIISYCQFFWFMMKKVITLIRCLFM